MNFASLLKENEISSSLAKAIIDQDIDENVFISMTEKDLAEIGPMSLGDKIKLRQLMKSLKVSNKLRIIRVQCLDTPYFTTYYGVWLCHSCCGNAEGG